MDPHDTPPHRIPRPAHGRLWFTADTHFSHARILDLCHRPRPTADAMNHALVQAWNRAITPDDTVVHLGDLALGSMPGSLQPTAALNGRRLLIPGNHDRPSPAMRMREDKRAEQTGWYTAAGWHVLPGVCVIDIDGRDVLLCHYPYRGDSRAGFDRYPQLRPADHGLPLLHGHIHDTRRAEGRMFNVGVDVNGYAPVPEEDVIDWLDATAAG